MVERRDWVFTMHYPPRPEEDVKAIITTGLAHLSKNSDYGIAALEKGKSGRTLHIQGFVQFKMTQQTTQLKRTLARAFEGGKSAYVAVRRGTPLQASKYCEKEFLFVQEYGTLDEERPTDEMPITLTEFFKKLKAGEDLNALFFQYPVMYALHGARIEDFYARFMKKYQRTRKPTVHYIYGPTETNKTRHVYDFDPEPYRWDYDQHFQGYSGQKTILFDDFRGQVPYDKILRICDRYQNDFPVKNARLNRVNEAENIFFTSDRPYTMHWPNDIDHVKSQFARRIDFVTNTETCASEQ